MLSRRIVYNLMKNRCHKSNFRYTRNVALSFDQSMFSPRYCPKYHLIDTYEPQTPGSTLILPFVKASDAFGVDVKEYMKGLLPEGINESLYNIAVECIEDGSFTANAKEKYLVRLPSSMNTSLKHVALVGIGRDLGSNNFHEFGRQVVDIAKELKANQIHVDISRFSELELSFVLHGIDDASYDDKSYKGVRSSDDNIDGNKVMENVSFISTSSGKKTSNLSIINNHKLTSIGVNVAKALVGTPPNFKTPVEIAEIARAIASQSKNMKCEILGKEECEERQMGGYLAVQQGSKFPPQFLHLTFTGGVDSKTSDLKKKIALVGKGLTFDSGGYNLKVGPGSMIEMMKFDMGGLGAVLGTAAALVSFDNSVEGKELLKGINDVEIHFISAVCENMISRDSMRPGDIVKASSGKTIEILNTDAEGRLTLADALVYADEVVGADVIIDLATLTGASMIALGENIGSLFVSSDKLRDELLKSSINSGETLWHMPLHPEYRKNIKSNLADIKNIGDGKAGSITAALFLQEFVREHKEWAHIDMAGPVWNNATHQPTGYGVKLLIEYILRQLK